MPIVPETALVQLLLSCGPTPSAWRGRPRAARRRQQLETSASARDELGGRFADRFSSRAPASVGCDRKLFDDRSPPRRRRADFAMGPRNAVEGRARATSRNRRKASAGSSLAGIREVAVRVGFERDAATDWSRRPSLMAMFPCWCPMRRSVGRAAMSLMPPRERSSCLLARQSRPSSWCSRPGRRTRAAHRSLRRRWIELEMVSSWSALREPAG